MQSQTLSKSEMNSLKERMKSKSAKVRETARDIIIDWYGTDVGTLCRPNLSFIVRGKCLPRLRSGEIFDATKGVSDAKLPGEIWDGFKAASSVCIYPGFFYMKREDVPGPSLVIAEQPEKASHVLIRASVKLETGFKKALEEVGKLAVYHRIGQTKPTSQAVIVYFVFEVGARIIKSDEHFELQPSSPIAHAKLIARLFASDDQPQPLTPEKPANAEKGSDPDEKVERPVEGAEQLTSAKKYLHYRCNQYLDKIGGKQLFVILRNGCLMPPDNVKVLKPLPYSGISTQSICEWTKVPVDAVVIGWSKDSLKAEHMLELKNAPEVISEDALERVLDVFEQIEVDWRDARSKIDGTKSPGIYNDDTLAILATLRTAYRNGVDKD